MDEDRELDVVLAQLLGWTGIETTDINGIAVTTGRGLLGMRSVVPDLSRHIEQVWKAAEAFAEAHGCGFAVARKWLRTPMHPEVYQATVMGGDLAYDTSDLVCIVHADTPAKALSLALLRMSKDGAE